MTDQTLDQFIAKLMSDDSALEQFLADPTNGEEEHGITKAERAVLRRTLAHLSNKSKNGYSVQRDLGSYRKSLRLLQNVLHKHAGTHAIAHAKLAQSSDSDTTVHIQVYFTGTPGTPGAPYTNPALAYTTYVSFVGVSTDGKLGSAMEFPNPPPSGNSYTSAKFDVADANHQAAQLSYTAIKIEDAWVIETFTLFDASGNNPQEYKLPFYPQNQREPFWYYSLDGRALEQNSGGTYSKNPDATQGSNGESFASLQLGSSTCVFWQGIAPDTEVGFGPCFTTSSTFLLLGLPVPNQPVQYTGNVFYRNTVNNVFIDPTVTKWTLSSTTDGTGDVVTDDVVEINVIGTYGSVTQIYTHDYSNNCSGVITPTPPVDLTSELRAYSGEYITLQIVNKDKCGGVERSSGYFLVLDFGTAG